MKFLPNRLIKRDKESYRIQKQVRAKQREKNKEKLRGKERKKSSKKEEKTLKSFPFSRYYPSRIPSGNPREERELFRSTLSLSPSNSLMLG